MRPRVSLPRRFVPALVTHLHGDPIWAELQIPLPSDLSTAAEALLRIAQMRVQDLLRERELCIFAQDASDLVERLQEAGVRRGDGRAVLGGQGGMSG